MKTKYLNIFLMVLSTAVLPASALADTVGATVGATNTPEIHAPQLTAQEIEADRRLDKEITEIQADYPDLDWRGEDQSGQNLEARIINFMLETKKYCFTSGFNLYLKENRELPPWCSDGYGLLKQN